MTYETSIEREGRILREQSDRRNAQLKTMEQQAAAERKAMLERTVQNYQAAEAQAERERIAADLAAHEAALKAAIRESFVRANGSDFGFNEVYPKLREAYVTQATLANVMVEPETTAAIAQRQLALRYRG